MKISSRLPAVKHRKLQIAYIFSTFVVLACASEPAQTADDAPIIAQTTRGILVAPAPDRNEACSEHRQVGLNPLPLGDCPDSTDNRWKKVNLFPHTNSNEFKKYCVYDWTAMGEAPDLDVLPGVTDPGDFLESDCEVLTTYGHPYTTNNTSLLESAFRAQIGQPTALPPPTAGATKVVVVDTSIDRAFPNGGPGVLDHGRAMAMLIRGLTCQGAGTCAAEVSSMLAMPLIKVGDNFQADYINGGYYGRPTDVARAIYKGVQTALASPGPNRLIINISAGWDSRWGGEIPLTGWEDLAPPIRMVYSAITYAACQGAIIIAASGNAGGGPLVETTAAYPAAWESVPAPDAGRCAAFNLAAPPASTSTYRPLVYAAGGLDGADNPLRSQRSESMPRIAAPASHATIYVGSYQTPLQTGTSVGAAVTSAAVALAWSYAPNLAGHDAMQMVYDAGADLSLTPNLCLGSPCSQSVRRISMCHTLAAACASSGRCGHLSSCEPHEPGRDLAPTGLVVSGVPVDQTPTTGTTPVPVDWPCTLEPWASTSSLDYPCPAQQLYSVYTVRYTVPQPLATICPTCIIQNNTIFIGIDNAVTGTVSDGMMAVTRTDNTEINIAFDTLDPMTGGDTAEVTLTSLSAVEIKSASIEFVIDGKTSTSDPVVIDKQATNGTGVPPPSF